MIYILYTYLIKDNSDEFIRNWLKIFPVEYRIRIDKFRKWQDAQASILGRLLLLHGLKQFINPRLKIVKIDYTIHNRPFLTEYPVDFNISHSGEIVVCAISTVGHIGVDVEKILKIKLQEFEPEMTGFEWHEIFANDDPQKEFYKYWTKKEAVIKADGKGHGIKLDSFEIVGDKTILHNKIYYLSELFLDKDYSCHIASNQKIDYKNIIVKKIDPGMNTTVKSLH